MKKPAWIHTAGLFCVISVMLFAVAAYWLIARSHSPLIWVATVLSFFSVVAWGGLWAVGTVGLWLVSRAAQVRELAVRAEQTVTGKVIQHPQGTAALPNLAHEGRGIVVQSLMDELTNLIHQTTRYQSTGEPMAKPTFYALPESRWQHMSWLAERYISIREVESNADNADCAARHPAGRADPS